MIAPMQGRSPGAAARAPVVRIGLVLALVAAGTAAGTIATVTAWRSPGVSAVSDSAWATALFLAAGASLIAAGLEHVRRGHQRRFGLLLTGAGIAWLAGEWGHPAIGSSAGFTFGLVVAWLTPAVMAHALLRFGRPALPPVGRIFVAAAYAIFGGLLGLVRAVTFDASATACSFCPADLVAFAPSADLSHAGVSAGAAAGAAATASLAVYLAVSLARQPASGRWLRAAVILPGALYAALVAIDVGRGVGHGVVPTGGPAHLIRLGEAAALLGMAAGSAARWVAARRSRGIVARVVAELAQSPPVGGLRDTLASILDDGELRLVYQLPDGRSVDASGRRIAFADPAAPGRRITPVVREGAVVALLEHRAEGLDAGDTLDQVIRAARLGLEHERLQAETRTQLRDLTDARRRIAAAAAGERQRLERDLHDGAQQHLIAIAVSIRLLDAELAGADADARQRVAAAGREVVRAVEELRDVAHGIYPGVLADEGLAAAIESLAEASQTPVKLGDVEVGMIDLRIAEAAYSVVATLVEQASGTVTVRASRDASRLTLVVGGPRPPAEVMVELGDRVGAVDGVLHTREWGAGSVELVAEIPCAS